MNTASSGDSGCNTTLIDDSLALTPGLKQKAFTSLHIKRCYVARVGKEEVKYLLRNVKTIPNLNGPDQKLKWSSMKREYCNMKDLDLQDTDTGPVQLIIGTDKSDLILPKRIVKPSGQSDVDRVPYAVENPLGWAVTNWLPGGTTRSLNIQCVLKCMREVRVKIRSCGD